MRENTATLHRFIHSLRKRLNRFRLGKILLLALLVVASLLTLVGAAYAIAGYGVPKLLYLWGAISLLVATTVISLLRRYSRDDTARFADQFYGLKDSLVTALHFTDKKKTGEFTALQVASANELAASLDPEKVKFEWPRKILISCGIVVLSATLLAFKQPSSEVLEKLRVEAETETKTEEINSHLKELAEELEKSLDEEQKAELDTKPIRRAVAEMEKTGDRKEAMRQYAELERQLRESARRLEQRRNEQLMARAGEELRKDPENRALGEKLAKKQFNAAAAEIREMQQANNFPPEELSARQKELARLKSAAQRMAAAANASSRQGATSSSNSQNSGSQSNHSNSAKSSGSKSSGGQQSGSPGQSGGDGESLEDNLNQLNEAVANLSKSLEKAANEQKRNGSISKKTQGECKSCRSSVSSQLQKLNASLCKMGAKQESRKKLLSMCQSLGQCQGYLSNSQCQSLSQSLSPKAGGKGIGAGTVESRRDAFGEEFPTGGEMTSLQGTKGQGPSSTTIEAADSGDGVSSRRTTNQRREFEKQMESFVQREDIPDDVKEGVKEYFTRIHETSEE